MSDLDATTPRIFLARHGETEWTKSGQYTGISDIPLTSEGVKQVTDTGRLLVGPRKLVDPARIARVWVSPRRRAHQTFQHLFGDSISPERVILTEDITEWDYGDYEGMVIGDIRMLRKERGLDQEKAWNIWRDGCQGGESADQVSERLDRLIEEILKVQGPHMDGKEPADVVLVAHGLILRCFVKRWLRYPLDIDLPMIMSPGAIAILSYKNHDVNQPGIYVGMALPSKEE
ncbi:putative phosphoglycerate mutase [Lojkania enalia]|uniref:Phosphoglycerate mutase n=1 Tax=Lojkania enalia TaxID=147567 RepID=A0A9P4K4Y3_9PLEO|nr:putative phosphoglycerate mutase [Didymosphaeria enalia]